MALSHFCPFLKDWVASWGWGGVPAFNSEFAKDNENSSGGKYCQRGLYSVSAKAKKTHQRITDMM